VTKTTKTTNVEIVKPYWTTRLAGQLLVAGRELKEDGAVVGVQLVFEDVGTGEETTVTFRLSRGTYDYMAEETPTWFSIILLNPDQWDFDLRKKGD
jgi:hypothetical protein